jgi:hypothetical protein
MEAFKLQSAMEYLMTYGWAILIIAIVLGAIFGLGLFNSANLAPKVSAGSCQVYRPQGPGTTSFINTEGACSNEDPQFAAQFNGVSSYINIPYSNTLYPTQYITVSLWFKTTESISGGWSQLINTAGFDSNCDSGIYCIRICCSTFYVSVATTTGSNHNTGLANSALPASQQMNSGNWNNVIEVYNGAMLYLYWDGALKKSISVTGTLLQSSNSITISDPAFAAYQGSIENVQIYNTSLTTNEITALYDEGIGGDPLVLNNLVAWWPLNGNANDYSGNFNNGLPTNVVFTSAWTSGYTAP